MQSSRVVWAGPDLTFGPVSELLFSSKFNVKQIIDKMGDNVQQSRPQSTSSSYPTQKSQIKHILRSRVWETEAPQRGSQQPPHAPQAQERGKPREGGGENITNVMFSNSKKQPLVLVLVVVLDG